MTSTPQPTQQAVPTPRVWDALLVLHRECAAYGLIPHVLQPYMTNDKLLEKVQADGKLDELLRLSRLLSSDVQEFSRRLSGILADHDKRAGAATSPDDLMFSLSIQDRYTEWGTSYESVVLPTVEAIVDIFAAVGADTQPLAIPSPMTVIEPQGAIDAEQSAGGNP